MERAISLQGKEIRQAMLSEGKFCDVTLLSNDGVAFNVHRSVLYMCSPYFNARFNTELKSDGDDDNTATMQDLNSYILGQIIDYAYTRVTKVSWENVKQLLPAVDMFLVDGMKKDCCNFLKDQLNDENCIWISRFADTYFAPELKEAADKYLVKNFVAVLEKSEELLELGIEDVISIFGSEDLNVPREEVVFDAVIKWIDHCPEQRKQHIARLMRCIRLGLLDIKYFLHRVQKHSYVAGNAECKPLLEEAFQFFFDSETIAQRDTVLDHPQLLSEIMFAIGGFSKGRVTAMIETYDARANRWVKIEEQDPMGPRACHKCAVIDFDIYVIGGFDGTNYLNSCRCFNVVRKEWREIGPMNYRRIHLSVACLDKVIYALGGSVGCHPQKTAERYDYITNQWTMIAHMNQRRSDACATTLNGLIYIVGGCIRNECLRSAEFYDPATNIWTLIADMSTCRSGVSCIAFQGSVYALGGYHRQANSLASCEMFSPNTRNWTAVPPMYNSRRHFSVGVMDDMLFAIGGHDGHSGNGIVNVEYLNAKNNEWQKATDLNLCRMALGVCVISGMPNITILWQKSARKYVRFN